jgi:hypothetical protein
MSYETFVGPIPEGYEVDHRCRNPICINPGHLEAVPPAINLSRRVMYRRHTARSDTLVEA